MGTRLHVLLVAATLTLGTTAGKRSAAADCYDMCTTTWCDYAPAYISNGEPGDLVVHRSQGVITLLLGLLQQFHTHVAMLNDYGYTVRHNTAEISTGSFDSIVNINVGLGDGWFFGLGSVDYGDVYIEPWFLAKPGKMRTQSVDGYFNRSTTSLLKVTNPSAADYTRSRLNAAGFDYHVGAFTNYYREIGKNGSHCSGSVTWASEGSGGGLSTRWYNFSTELMTAAWQYIYTEVHAATYRSRRSGDLDSDGRHNIARTIADQVMNCFRDGSTPYPLAAFTGPKPDWCRTLGGGWRDRGAFGGYTNSPDDLVSHQNDAWQDYITPASWAGGYYHSCQTTTDWNCMEACYNGEIICTTCDPGGGGGGGGGGGDDPPLF